MLNKIAIFIGVLFSSLMLAAGSIEIFPADFQNGRYAFNADHISGLKIKFFADGNAMIAAGNPRLVIEVDDDLKVVAVAPMHPTKTMVLKFTQGNGKAVIELPASYVREMIREKNHWWGSQLLVFFQASKSGVGKRFPASYLLQAGDKTFASKTLQIAIHPALPAVKKLKTLRFGHWGFNTLFLPKEYEHIFQKNIQFWSQICDKPGFSVSGAFYTIPAERQKYVFDNLECTILMHSRHDTPVVLGTPYKLFDSSHRVSRPGVQKLMAPDGSFIPGAICPTYIVKDPEKIFWDKHIVEGLHALVKKTPGATAILINYESMPQNGVCDACRADFAAKYKLSAVPSINDVVKGKYRLQWRRYRADVRTQIIKRLSEIVHREFPNMKFRVCTVSLKPEENWLEGWAGIDVRSLNKYVDEFENMLYTAGRPFYTYLEYNLKELSKPLRVLCDPAETHIRWFQRYTPVTLRQNILATYALGCKTFQLYPEDYYDAAYLTMITEAYNAVAEAEDAFLKGQVKGKAKAEAVNTNTLELRDGKNKRKITVPDFSKDFKYLHHRDGKNDFVTLFNYSDSAPIIARVAIADYSNSNCNVTDLISRDAYTGLTANDIRKGFLVMIEPNGSVLLKLGEKADSKRNVTQAFMQNELKKSTAAALKDAKLYKAVYSKVKKNARIDYIISYGVPAVEMVDHGSYLHIDPARGGKFVAWRIPAIGEYMGGGSRKSIGEIFLKDGNYLPNPIPYTVTDRVIDKDGVKVSMEYVVPTDQDAGGSGNPLEGLKITRTVTLKDYFSNVRLTHTMTNTGRKPMTFAFRLRNLPVNRWKPSTTEDLPFLGADDSKPGVGEFMYKRAGSQMDWKLVRDCKELKNLDVYFRFGFLKMLFRFPDFTGLYLYGNAQLQTVEALSPTITLKPGESAKFDMEILRVDTRKK